MAGVSGCSSIPRCNLRISCCASISCCLHPRGNGNDNSGVFIRFRDPRLPDPAPDPVDPANNAAFVAVHTGYEVQIDEEARGDTRFNEPDGSFFSRTGAIYKVI